MGKVSAGVVVQSEELLVMKELPDPHPVLPGHLTYVGHSHFLKGGNLDPGAQDRPVGAEVCIGTGMGLNICMFGSEKLLCLFAGIGLDLIDVGTARIESVEGKAFGIFVSQEVAHGSLNR